MPLAISWDPRGSDDEIECQYLDFLYISDEKGAFIVK